MAFSLRHVRPAIERFWDRVDHEGDPADPANCWRWTGYLKRDGYGLIRHNTKQMLVHRFSYEQFVGPIPEGLQLDHLCRNRWCVNPNHLEPVTNRENALRGESFSAANAKKTHCPQGHPYDAKNTYIWTNGARHCKTCRRQRDAARKNRAA